MSSISLPRDGRIVAQRLTYTTPDGRTLFSNVDLSFGRDRTGLIGANGSGKTTLLELLAGERSPTSGHVQRSVQIATLPQNFCLPPDSRLADILGIEAQLAALERMEVGAATADDINVVADNWDLHERAAAVLAQFGLQHLQLDRAIGALSGGETTRVALARLTLSSPDFLLLDEPTNHLDADSRQALYLFVEEWTGGLLCISHDRDLLRRMDRIVELSSLGIRVYGGNFDSYRARRDIDDDAAARELGSARAAARLAEREAREVRERQARREARGKRDRITANMPKILLNTRRSSAQATSAMVRAISEREVEERHARVAAARRRVEERERPRFDLPSSGLHANRTVLSLDDVSVRFAKASAPVLEHIALKIVGPERVAIVGPNGSGKSTLLRVATGALVPDAGEVRRLPGREIAVLDQNGAALDHERSVVENFRAFHPQMEESAVRYALARFLFSHDAALQSVATLSGGQRLRASLSCVLGGERPPSLLVLDEPTNHLDFDALESLESALRSYDGALLVVSHDASFLASIGVERTLTIGHG